MVDYKKCDPALALLFCLVLPESCLTRFTDLFSHLSTNWICFAQFYFTVMLDAKIERYSFKWCHEGWFPHQFWQIEGLNCVNITLCLSYANPPLQPKSRQWRQLRNRNRKWGSPNAALYRLSWLQWHPWDKGQVSLYPTVTVSSGSSLPNQSFGIWEKCHSNQLSL